VRITGQGLSLPRLRIVVAMAGLKIGSLRWPASRQDHCGDLPRGRIAAVACRRIGSLLWPASGWERCVASLGKELLPTVCASRKRGSSPVRSGSPRRTICGWLPGVRSMPSQFALRTAPHRAAVRRSEQQRLIDKTRADHASELNAYQCGMSSAFFRLASADANT